MVAFMRADHSSVGWRRLLWRTLRRFLRPILLVLQERLLQDIQEDHERRATCSAATAALDAYEAEQAHQVHERRIYPEPCPAPSSQRWLGLCIAVGSHTRLML